MADPKESDSPYDFAPLSDPLAPREKQTIKKPPAAKPENQPASETQAPAEPAYERICPHCGYKILTKPSKGRCPECAGALDVAANLLQFADGDWLTGMSNGVLLLAASIGIHVAGCIVVAMGKERMGDLVHAIAGVISVAGLWMATASEPGAGAAKASPLIRIPALAAAAMAAALWVWMAVLEPHNFRYFVPAALVSMAAEAGFVAFYLRALAVRVPNDSLGRHLINVGLLTVGMCLLLGGLCAVGVSSENLKFSFFCGFPMLGCMVIVTLWALVSLARMAMELRNSAVAGRLIVQRQEQRAKAAAEKTAANKR